MAFPLAHPAAVLPLRRFCPGRLSLPALVIGSVTPDAGYLFGRFNLDELSHRFLGSLSFCLVVGVVMVVCFYRLRSWVVDCLPARYQQVFRPLCQQPAAGPLAIGLSLLLGAWTHLLWDAVTHKDGWFVLHVPLLQAPVLRWGGHQARLCHLIWYISSFFGIAWLYWTYQRWRQTPAGGSCPGSSVLLLRNAVLVALLFLPLEALHHLIEVPLGAYSVGALTVVLAVGAVWQLDRTGECG